MGQPADRAISALEQIERLSREADASLVDVRAMLGDIARTALANAAQTDRKSEPHALKVAVERALKHGAPRGSMELAKLAEAYSKDAAISSLLASGLRVMVTAAQNNEQVPPELVATFFSTLAQWEMR